jgi:hypothetical protein
MIKRIRKILPFLFPVLLFVFSSPLFAAEFGLLLNQNLVASGLKEDFSLDYSAALIPHFSLPIGENMELYASASAQVNYENDLWNFVPELFRTDFSWHSGASSLTLGRMNYSDPLGFIASGLFDGVQYSYGGGAGTFNVGAWYTGFLYKENARISMTDEDKTENAKQLDYGDFLNTYFASRRLLMSLGWEHPGLAGFLRAKFAVLGQIDLNEWDSAFHSQYITAKIGLPLKDFDFNLGGTFEIAEVDEGADIGIKFAYAGEAGISWFIPTGLPDQLSLLARFASGGTGGAFIAFVPKTTRLQGDILKADFSALSVFSLGYLARFHSTFSASLNTSVFMRTDLATYSGYSVGSESKYFLGSEIFARLYWSPISDVRINGGGGVFLPYMGESGIAWRAELGLIVALF